MIDFEDSSTWDRTEEGLLICPGCGESARPVGDSTWVSIIHPPGCTLPQWEEAD